MKILLALLIACTGAFLLTAGGCASRPACPNQDVYVGIVTPFGLVPLQIPKGWLDDPGNYLTEEDLKWEGHGPSRPDATERVPPGGGI